MANFYQPDGSPLSHDNQGGWRLSCASSMAHEGSRPPFLSFFFKLLLRRKRAESTFMHFRMDELTDTCDCLLSLVNNREESTLPPWERGQLCTLEHLATDVCDNIGFKPMIFGWMLFCCAMQELNDGGINSSEVVLSVSSSTVLTPDTWGGQTFPFNHILKALKISTFLSLKEEKNL